jgi:uncharacterized protein YdaU (DUF1376 family)
MPKDPAFLFYAKDFYEGTRMMLPEERACYLDLLIFQHQNGYIPTETKRVLMYCSGVDEATLKATLKAKFKQCDKGWYNHRLSKAISEREEYANKQSENGKIGQFFKKAKTKVSAKDLKALKAFVYNELSKDKLVEILNNPSSDPLKEVQGLLKASLKHLANAIEDVNTNEEVSKKEKVKIPTLQEFVAYGTEQTKEVDPKAFEFKYKAWTENDWRDGYNNPIKNWKSKLLNTIPHLNKQNYAPAHKAKSSTRVEPSATGPGQY